MKDKKVKKLFLKFLSFVLSIFGLLAFLSSALDVMAYSEVLTDIYKGSSLVSITSYVNNIKYALSFGKPIEKFYGMNDILSEILEISPDFISVGIVDSERNILYNVGKNVESIPIDLISEDYIIEDEGFYIKSEINDKFFIFLLLDKSYVINNRNSYMKNMIIVDVILAALLSFLTWLVFLIVFRKKKKNILFNDLKLPGIAILIFVQLIMGAFIIFTYSNKYVESLEMMRTRVSSTVKKDLEKVLNQGIELEKISGVDEYFDSLVKDIEEFDKIYLTSKEFGDSTTDKIVSGQRTYYININAHINENVVKSEITEFVVDALVLITMTIVASLESGIFIGDRVDKKENEDDEDEKEKKRKKKIKTGNKPISLSGMRLFMFVLELALSLDAGFISIVSYKLFKNLNMNNPPSFLSGLPVTLGLVSTMLGILFWGKFVFKLGLKRTLILGTCFCAGGFILSSLSSTLLLLCFSRIIYGYGIASILTVTRVCVSSQEDIQYRTKFSSFLSIGMLVGSSCGVIIGGLLADRTSYNFVFLFEGIISLASLFLIPITKMNNNIDCVKAFSFREIFKILKSPFAALFIFLFVIPIYMSSMFVGYVIPLFGDEINLSQTIISAMIMMNYVITAYLTDPISRLFLKKFGVNKSMYIYGLIVFIVVLIFCVVNLFFSSFGIVAAILSVILLAIADSFGLIAIGEFLNVNRVNDVSRTTSSLIILLAGKLGACIAPTLISANLSYGVTKSAFILPAVLLISFLLYYISSKVIFYKSRS